MTVQSLFPILLTPDLPGLVAFYTSALDAVVAYRFPDEEGADAYVSLSIGPSSLGIGRDPAAAGAATDRAALWFSVDDVDETHEKMLSAGATRHSPPTDMPWGERVAQVRDPAGTLVNIATPPG